MKGKELNHTEKLGLCRRLLELLEEAKSETQEIKKAMMEEDALDVVSFYLNARVTSLNDAWKMYDFLFAEGRRDLASELASYLPGRDKTL